jgi:hypothetical protein
MTVTIKLRLKLCGLWPSILPIFIEWSCLCVALETFFHELYFLYKILNFIFDFANTRMPVCVCMSPTNKFQHFCAIFIIFATLIMPLPIIPMLYFKISSLQGFQDTTLQNLKTKQAKQIPTFFVWVHSWTSVLFFNNTVHIFLHWIFHKISQAFSQTMTNKN